ncbi:unnamed protein product [Lactuca saligna]|uniref:Uncharacterized protein n=1 Tax=Lactuca saligna TaxID=75948 RepID=A0AA35ZYF1_LACSI|nr:unnamed protein product [Lactuca saligna]
MNKGVRRKHKVVALYSGPCLSQVTKRTEGRRSSQAVIPDVLVDRSQRGRRLRGSTRPTGRKEEAARLLWPQWVQRGVKQGKEARKGSDEQYDVAGRGFGVVCLTEEEEMCERLGCCLDGSPKHHHSRWFMTEDEETGRKSRKKGKEKESGKRGEEDDEFKSVCGF